MQGAGWQQKTQEGKQRSFHKGLWCRAESVFRFKVSVRQGRTVDGGVTWSGSHYRDLIMFVVDRRDPKGAPPDMRWRGIFKGLYSHVEMLVVWARVASVEIKRNEWTWERRRRTNRTCHRLENSGWGEGRVRDDIQVSFFPGQLNDWIVIYGDKEHRERSSLEKKKTDDELSGAST